MGNHVDTRGSQRRHKLREGDEQLARRRRVGFKQYLRDLEEELEEDLLEADLSPTADNQDE